ncbi:sugar ABC transporter ATP-binding protein [Okibacterium endophyticum]
MTPTSRGAVGAAAAPAAAPTGAVALTVTGLTKHFGGTTALDNASLTVRRGTVHALLGGNGSGKSTAIKILASVYTADAGELTIFDRNVPLDSSYLPNTAQAAGLRFVHQDLGLFDDLSIEENFALDAGYPLRAGGSIRWRRLRERVGQLLAEYELRADPRTPVKDLRPSDRTMVAIARALQDQEGAELILVLDEPTASLAAHESSLLLQMVRRRADKGQTVLIVSHRMHEVLSVAEDFTVFRDGKVAGTLVDSTPTEDELVSLMAGGAVAALRPTGSIGHATGKNVLRVDGLTGGPLNGVDLSVDEGEIVGIAGLVGSGRSSLLGAIFGAERPVSGTIRLDGERFAPAHIGDAMEAGIALVPEDRGRDAAFADLSIQENIAMSVLRENWVTRWMPRSRESSAARDLIRRFSIKTSGPAALFSSMSGGNQQKAIIARWLQRNPRLLLLDEPTQGVDVMSRSDIYAVIRQAAAGGCAVLVASSDMSELHALCDRIVLLRGGRIGGEVLAGEVDIDGLTALVLKDPTGSIRTIQPPPSAPDKKRRS